MKKISLIIALLVIIGAVVFALMPGKSQETAIASAQVTVLEKTVMTGKDKGSVQEIQEDTSTVEAGSYLKTGDKGRALIELGKAETVVDYNSEVVIADTSKDGSKISLFIGATWSRVEKLFDKGEYHEIKTQNTVASVRGTSFGVYYDQKSGTSRLVVATGTVAFSALDDNGNIIATSTVDVYGGEEASRIGSGLIIKIPMREETKKDAWFIFNSNEKRVEVKKDATAKPQADTAVSAPVTTQTTVQTQPVATQTQTQASAPIDTDYRFKISLISPNSAEENSGKTITIQGVGFTHLTALKLGDYDVNYKRISDEKLTFVLSDDIDDGVYDVKIKGEGGRTYEIEGGFTVIKPEPVQQEPDPAAGEQNYIYDPNGTQQ